MLTNVITMKRIQRIREWAAYQLMSPVRWLFERWMNHKQLVLIYCVMGNGIGDALAISTVLNYLHQRDGVRGIVFSMHPDLFLHNPQVVCNLDYKSMPSLKRSLFKSLLRALRGRSVICFGGEVWTLKTNPLSCEHIDDKRKKGWIWLQHLTPDHQLPITTLTANPKIVLDEDEVRRFSAKYNWLPKKFAVVKASVGTARPQGALLKNWRPERFAAVVEQTPDLNWVQLGELDEEPVPGAVSLLGKTNLREAMFLISRAQLLLSVEGFLTHVAAAFDRATVIPFTGAYDPMAFVYQSTIPVIADPLPLCSPCWKTLCDVPGMPCRDNLRVEMVVAAINKAIEHAQSNDLG